MKIRLIGVLLLAVAFAIHRIYMLVHVVPGHEITAMELILGFVGIVAGVVGATMLFVGPALFRTYA